MNPNEAALPGRGLHYTERLKLQQLDSDVNQLKVDMGGHLKECTLQNTMIWQEIHGLKKIVWVAVVSSLAASFSLIAFLLKIQMHL